MQSFRFLLLATMALATPPDPPATGCAALAAAPGLSGLLFLPGSAEYTSTIESYYAKDVQNVRPACVLQPTSASEVSAILRALNSPVGQHLPVAVRSGGHAPFAANNVLNGVTIDLSRLNKITYHSCNKAKGTGVASIGPGARWGEVYAALEAKGVMVTGGREGHVGVGGLLLGGGFSWYVGKHGMGLDNVLGYEVVLADGSIVTVDSKTRPDLFKALKGGMNNFGIVTKFDMPTFASHDVYGGIVAYSWDKREALLQNLVDMVNANEQRPAEGGWLNLAAGFGRGPSVSWVCANVDNDANSTSFQPLASLGPLLDTRATTPVSSLVNSIVGTLGLYQVWYTLTLHNTIDMGRKVAEVFDETQAQLAAKVDEAYTVVFLFSPMSSHLRNRGVNSLGLDHSLDVNSNVIQIEAFMPGNKYWNFVDTALRTAMEKIEAYARETNQLTEYLYTNYANQAQNPIGSYGADNVRFLQETARKYDPTEFFQKRVAGGFKVSRAG